MPRILLAGKEWKARALLRAQLIEEGLDVEAYETVADALATLEGQNVLPALFLADLSESDTPSDDVSQLAEWSGQIPIWIITRRELIPESSLECRGLEAILFRPVDMGRLVEQIKHRLTKS